MPGNASEHSPAITVGLVGNPNCGKTTLFNGLTASRQTVGNWPGVTVERVVGRYRHDGRAVNVVDLPGVYALSAFSDGARDERVALDYLLAGEADLFVNIVDASNLERNLYLTVQLLEMRVPVVLALNMLDIAHERRIRIDLDALSAALGCPVVPLVASRGTGLGRLKDVIASHAGHAAVPARIPYGEAVESALERLRPSIAPRANALGVDPRWYAIKLLEGDFDATTSMGAQPADACARLRAEILDQSGEDADILIADGRFAFAGAAKRVALRREGVAGRSLTDSIDTIVLHRAFGIPIFLGVMYLLFVFAIHVGSAFIDFFDILAGTLLVEGFGRLLAALGAPEGAIVVLAGGVGGGLQTVATFIPIIACLYLFLSFLEDCGYMARAAFVMDRLMRTVGLPGKSFIPLIVGFGCNVPAIMASRTLESRRDRIVTVMMAPFMSCGARLPVYALFAAAFFPDSGQNLVFALYLIGIAFAVLTGLVLRTTLLQGEAAPFVMELPPYHLPTFRGIVLRTWDRMKAFVLRAGRVIVPVVAVLSVLGSIGTDGSFGHENRQTSVLAEVGRAVTPVLAPMGITQDNWPAAVGMLTGIFAKEAVVGTLNAIYGSFAQADDVAAEPAPGEGPADLVAGIVAAAASIPSNLAELAGALGDPLGFSTVANEDLQAAAGAQGAEVGIFGEMASRFDGALGAFAYLLAVLLYMPCVAAMAAVWRETGPRWAGFAALWTTGLGYGAAVIAYQAGSFARHPTSSMLWIAAVLGTFATIVAVLRFLGGRDRSAVALAAE
jgi:ferrous iron transport protein B